MLHKLNLGLLKASKRDVDVCSNLAEEDGHAVVVEEEGLWKARVVKLEEEGGEAQSDILLRRDTEGRTKQLHSSHWDE